MKIHVQFGLIMIINSLEKYFNIMLLNEKKLNCHSDKPLSVQHPYVQPISLRLGERKKKKKEIEPGEMKLLRYP